MSYLVRDNSSAIHIGNRILPLKNCNGALLCSRGLYLCSFEPIADDLSYFIAIDDKVVGEFKEAYNGLISTNYVTSIKCGENAIINIREIENVKSC